MRILFYSDKIKVIDGQPISGEPLTTLWDDILSNNLHQEGGVGFPKGKRDQGSDQALLRSSDFTGDLVLNSFGGSRERTGGR